MASLETVTELLQGLWTTFSRYPPTDMREAAYASWFETLRNVADNDLIAAAKRWVENESNLPVPASLLAMSDTERHRRTTPPRPVEGGMAPHVEYPIEPGAAFGILKTARKAVSEGATQAEVDVLVRENYRDDFQTGDDAKTYGCPKCRDNRFLPVGPVRDNIVRPCDACNGKTYERWAQNHFLPNHSCDACSDIVRGRRSRRGDDD